jgi:hypothetical protein
MICEHLRSLEEALVQRGFVVTYRGQTWTRNCREWVYFNCVLSLSEIRTAFVFDPCIRDHVHRGTHEGSEQGFVCSEHWDAVMGAHPEYGKGLAVYDGRDSGRHVPLSELPP